MKKLRVSRFLKLRSDASKRYAFFGGFGRRFGVGVWGFPTYVLWCSLCAVDSDVWVRFLSGKVAKHKSNATEVDQNIWMRGVALVLIWQISVTIVWHTFAPLLLLLLLHAGGAAAAADAVAAAALYKEALPSKNLSHLQDTNESRQKPMNHMLNRAYYI